ncbi:nuclear transport factor 2 family protein [Amycolatopsis sp. FDAARGOS 1241]|uniref:nuclear transport factor 2 family protein n=1 Tax=Amycolatopsis sp. FDAARGOS 1241 TaxID=2778070 RepID=UPI00194F88B2|nr:nuclear transport factor 2 family protein [Amycolatopsis sp. FDAARGOS 1241]QRP49707.1 nuclear transport factor 2 family protein [Amycolatopsis sp. FDAARGOS 1241]
MTTDIEHIFTAWDGALGAEDVDAAMALYAEDATLESPLVCPLLGTDEGVARGRGNLREFVEKVFAHQPAKRRRYRTGYVTDGARLHWGYRGPRPTGSSWTSSRAMEVRDGVIAHHRVYWGRVGVGMLARGEHSRQPVPIGAGGSAGFPPAPRRAVQVVARSAGSASGGQRTVLSRVLPV